MGDPYHNSRGCYVWRWMTSGFLSYLSWFVVNLLLAVLFPVLVAMRLIGGRQLIRRILVSFLRVYFLTLLPLFGLYRVDKQSDTKAVKAIGRGLVVANHTSWLDALVVIALVPNVRPLVSTRYGRVPLVSTAMQWLGCIFIDRRDRASISAAIDRIREYLRRGVPVAVFPEGTRAEVGHLKPFQEVFFSLAVEERAVVEPILLCLDIPFLGPGAENFVTKRTANLRISKLSPIIPDARERGKDLAFRTRSTMRKALKRIA